MRELNIHWRETDVRDKTWNYEQRAVNKQKKELMWERAQKTLSPGGLAEALRQFQSPEDDEDGQDPK